MSHAITAAPGAQPAPPPGQVSRRVVAPQTTPSTNFPCQGLGLGRIAVYAFATVAFIFINKGGAAGNALFFLVVAGMMLGTPMSALMGFSCAVLALTVNTAFVVKSIAFTFSRVFSIGLFATRFTLAGNLAFLNTAPYITATIFCVTAAVCSIINGYFTHIALIKVFIFWVGITGFFAFVSTIRQRRIDTTEWFVSQTLAVVLLSILAVALGVSQNFKGPNTSHGLYNLAFYHSQTAGPIFALLVVYLLCVVLFAGHRNRWMCLPLITFLTYGLFLTRSRTGAGTLIAGVLMTIGLALVWGRGKRFSIRLNYSRALILAVILVAVVGAVLIDTGSRGALVSGVRSFLIKSFEEVQEIEAADVVSSRSGLIARSWSNFRESPLTGIGFGLSTDRQFAETATMLYAPTEKGFLPTALLEEVGIVGTTAFVIFVVAMFRSLIRDRNIPGVAMFTSLLVLNLGEAGIFALGGHAAFMWLFVLGGIVLGDRCTTAVRWNSPHLGNADLARNGQAAL